MRSPLVYFVDFDGDGVLDVVSDLGVYLLDRVLRDTVPPLPPTYVTAHAAAPGSSQVTIAWEAPPDPDVVEYHIFRGNVSGGSDYEWIGTVAHPQTQFTFNYPAEFCRYRVRAVDRAGNFSYWAEAEFIGGLPASRVAGDARPDYSIAGSILVGDVTGDGRNEVFVRREHRNELWTDYSWALYTVSPAGVFTPVWEHRWGRLEQRGVVIERARLLGDVTGDGRADVLVQTQRSVDVGGTIETRWVFDLYRALEEGVGFETTPAATIVLPENVEWSADVAWGDANGDGLKDLAVGTYGPNRKAALSLRNDDPETGVISFEPTPAWLSPVNNIEALAFGNMNNDARADLAIVEDINNSGNSSRVNIYVHTGTSSGLSAAAAWQRVSAGTNSTSPIAVSWTDFNGDGRADLTVFTDRETYAYANTGSGLPASSYTLMFTQTLNPVLGTKPAHYLMGWANIDGTGALDLYGANTVIRNAGAMTGLKDDSNFDSGAAPWGDLTTYVWRNVAMDRPWRNQGSSFNNLAQAVDLTGNGVADLIGSQANLILLSSPGAFPPTPTAGLAQLVLSIGDSETLDRPGERRAITVTAVFEGGGTQDVTNEAVFSLTPMTDGNYLARMEGNELVSMVSSAYGASTLSVKWQNASATSKIHVAERPPVPESLRIAPAHRTLTRPGEPLPLSAILRYEGGADRDVTPEVTFTSNTAAVTIQGALAIANQNGVATISASHSGKSASATITTALSVGIRELTIAPGAISLPVSGERALEVRIYYADGTSEPVTHLATLTSLEPAVATVIGNRVTGVAPGTARVRAAYRGATAEALVAVDSPGPAVLRILEVGRADDRGRLRWQAAPAIGAANDFQVLMRPSLTEGGWVPAGETVRGHPSGFVDWEDLPRPDASSLFYKLDAVPRAP